MSEHPDMPPKGGAEVLPVQCAWCRLWRVDAVWTATPPPHITKPSHGICPKCAAKMLGELKAA